MPGHQVSADSHAWLFHRLRAGTRWHHTPVTGSSQNLLEPEHVSERGKKATCSKQHNHQGTYRIPLRTLIPWSSHGRWRVSGPGSPAVPPPSPQHHPAARGEAWSHAEPFPWVELTHPADGRHREWWLLPKSAVSGAVPCEARERRDPPGVPQGGRGTRPGQGWWHFRRGAHRPWPWTVLGSTPGSTPAARASPGEPLSSSTSLLARGVHSDDRLTPPHTPTLLSGFRAPRRAPATWRTPRRRFQGRGSFVTV